MKAALLLCLASTAALFAPTASADECGGQVVGRTPLVVNGQQIGEVQLNYNREFGRYCAATRHAGPTWGVTLPTHIRLTVCENRDYCTSGVISSEQSSGPEPYVRVIRAPGGVNRCGLAYGKIYYRGAWYGREVSGCAW